MMYRELLLYNHRNRYIHWFLECLQGLYKCRAGQNYHGSHTDVCGVDTCMRAKKYCTLFQEIVCINSKRKKNKV